MKCSNLSFCLFLGILLGSFSSLYSQGSQLKGKVVDPFNEVIPEANIRLLGTERTTRTDAQGKFTLRLIPAQLNRVEIRHVGHQTTIIEVRAIDGVNYDRTIKMLPRESEEVEIVGQKDATSISDDAMLVSPIELDKVIEMPIAAPSLEYYAKYQPGVATNSEFSSQYQVRGGNFDENLVYVNGIEIYRPFLARSGQQEGLGFSNASMAQNLQFSTGGFGAQYGDKLSSVLDITYRQPKEFRATVEAGILSTNLHVEGISKNKKEPEKPGKFTYLMGARRFSLAYLLNSLDQVGQYRPLYLDYQGMFTYTPKSQYYPEKIRQKANGELDTVYYANEKLKFTTFFALNRNRYQFLPVGQETTIGTVTKAFRLRVAFEGREISAYTTSLGAFMVEHKPSTRLEFDYILTAFNTQELERIDVEGGYLLGEVNTNFGSEEFNESDFDLGIGTLFQHARNYLSANVYAGQLKGRWTSNNRSTHKLLFGLKAERQDIDDDLKEYAARDSAGYLVDSLGNFGLDYYSRGQQVLTNYQYKAYLQHEWNLSRSLKLSTGARLVYNSLLDQWMFSPRVQLLWKALQDLDGETRMRFRLASGMYQQAPFYREFRRFDGSVNLDVNPQRSLHTILGMEYRFYAWGRPFLLFSEAYYKRLYDLIPYEVQNVRIRYYPDEIANGYAYGIDTRLNGEFIKGVDSWVSLGLLKTEEDVIGDELGYVPRPTDQRVTFAMYFQDELPINPTYKVHISYVYGSGMRYGAPRRFDLRTFRQFPAYHRADLGFSKVFSFADKPGGRNKLGMESIWATLEIFNLFQRENTVSFTWIQDLNGIQYAVNNRLSARLLNARIVMKFR